MEVRRLRGSRKETEVRKRKEKEKEGHGKGRQRQDKEGKGKERKKKEGKGTAIGCSYYASGIYDKATNLFVCQHKFLRHACLYCAMPMHACHLLYPPMFVHMRVEVAHPFGPPSGQGKLFSARPPSNR